MPYRRVDSTLGGKLTGLSTFIGFIGIINDYSSEWRYEEAVAVHAMSMTFRLTEEEQDALREQAALEGISMEEAVRRAVREHIANAGHRDRVAAAAELVTQRHAVALRRLGE